MDFWNKFINLENRVSHESKNMILNQLVSKMGYVVKLYILPNSTYLNKLTMYISPNYNKKNLCDMHKLYDSSLFAKIPEYWDIRKYAPRILNYDFSDKLYYTVDSYIFEKSLSLSIFIEETIAKSVLTKEDIWKFLNTEISRKLIREINNQIGEYNILHKIKKIRFLPATCAYTKNKKLIRIPHIQKEFNIYKEKDYKKCNYCNCMGYNKNINECKCKHVYYCSHLCKINDTNHLLVCA